MRAQAGTKVFPSAEMMEEVQQPRDHTPEFMMRTRELQVQDCNVSGRRERALPNARFNQAWARVGSATSQVEGV
jgi:hypothetical protein